jgi:hypothetical protein
MSDLAQLQTAFSRVILGTENQVPAGVQAQGRCPERGLFVYRNNVVSGLARALRARFPVVEQLVGAEFFQTLAAAYVVEEPPRSPVLLHYGETFPAFIDNFVPAAPIPYLGDVARIELARGVAYHAADAAPVERAAFAALPMHRLAGLHLRLHPSLTVVISQYPAYSIWRVNQNVDRLVPVSPWAPEAIVIVRPFDQVEMLPVPRDAAQFIQCLGADASLGEAFSTAAAGSAAFDIGEAVRLLIAADIVVGFGKM